MPGRFKRASLGVGAGVLKATKPSRERKQDGAEGTRAAARTRTESAVSSGLPNRDDDSEAIPAQLGRYTILGRVGRGAVGEVFEAEPPEPGAAPVALKAIRGMSPDALYRFKREFRALADVQHRNVIRLHELMLQGSRLFFSMELIRGRSFTEALCGPARDGARTVHDPARDYDTVRDAMRQLAEGVQAIHDAGFLHRDLKPSNVLVEESGRVVILDFGLVRGIDTGDNVGVTADGAVLGTPLFMSPEQAAGSDVGTASDWYTVGEMLYQVLTGSPPYAGLGLLALLAAKKEEAPKLPSAQVTGVPPDLQSLCLDLLQRDPAKRPGGDEVLTRLGSTERSEKTDSGPLFLGREMELRLFQRAFAATRKGKPVVVLLEGVSGIGKSALVEQFLRRVSKESGALVLSGKCSERESIPYKALDSVMDMLSAHLRAMATAAEVQAVLPRNVAALARLFPVLLSVPAVAVAPLQTQIDMMPQEARRRGIESLRELLGRVADRRPVVLYIDDLQWSDVDSLVVLESMLHDVDAPPLMLVCSFRQAAAERAPMLGRFVADLHDIEPGLDLRALRLGPMGLEEARGLALRMLGDSPIHRTLAAEVAREAEGSPFFVAQLVRHAQRTQRGDLSATDSSVSLDDVIRHRLNLLSPGARRLLAVVSVAGGRMELGLATQLAELDGSSQDVLADLRAESLVRTDGTSDADTLEIYHDRIRETVLRGLDPRSTTALHLRIAQALAASKAPDAALLSHHYRRGGDPVNASRYTVAAADLAAEALAFDRAAELYQAAIDLGALDAQERPAIEERYAHALANAGRQYEAAKMFLSAADKVTTALQPPLLRAAAELLLTSGHSREGRVVLKQALAAHGVELPATRGRAIASLISHRAALFFRGLATPESTANDGPVPAPILGRLDALWTAARGLIYIDGLLGATFQARHLRLALKSGDTVHLARALGFEAHLTSSMKPISKRAHCFELVDRAAALAEKAGSAYASGMVQQARGHVHLFLGEWQQACENLDDATKTFIEHTTGSAQEVGYCESHAALCLQFMGRARELAPRAAQLLRDSTQRSHPYAQGFARGLLGHLVYLVDDRVDEAEEQLTLYREHSPVGFQAHIQNYVSQTTAMLRYTGDPDAAWRLVEARGPEIEAFDIYRSPFPQAEHRFWIAQNALAMAIRKKEERTPFLQIAWRHGKKLVSSMPAGYQRAYGHLTLAGVLEHKGEDEAAASRFRRALEGFDAHRMDSLSSVCCARLANLVGGAEADALQSRADAYIERERIVAPQKLFEMIAPGSATLLPWKTP